MGAISLGLRILVVSSGSHDRSYIANWAWNDGNIVQAVGVVHALAGHGADEGLFDAVSGKWKGRRAVPGRLTGIYARK